MMELFPGTFSQLTQSIRLTTYKPSLPPGQGILTLFPRLRLSPSTWDRLTLRGLTLRRNPWIFGDRFFTLLIVTYVAFALLIPQDPSRVSLYRLTERSATRYNFQRNYKSTDSVHDLSPVTSLAETLLDR